MNWVEYVEWFKTVKKDGLPDGVRECLAQILTMMTVEREKFPSAESVVLNRIETEAEVFMVMGLVGWSPDKEDFKAWVRTAKYIGLSKEECEAAVDRGAERGRL